jgi:hypothetical protein
MAITGVAENNVQATEGLLSLCDGGEHSVAVGHIQLQRQD